MNVIPKILITPEESEWLTDTSLFHFRKRFFRDLQEVLLAIRDGIINLNREHALNIPEDIDRSTGKISRGMSYMDLPYMVLDFPRLFSRERICGFRLVFVWGNGFSFQFLNRGNLAYGTLSGLTGLLEESKDLWICGEEGFWTHFPERHGVSRDPGLLRSSTFRIHQTIPLNELDNFAEKYLKFYESIAPKVWPS